MTIEQTSRDRASLVRLGLVASSMAAVAVAACEGPNQFTGPGTGGGGGGPAVEVEEVRSSLPLGDSLLVEASASSGAGIVGLTFVGRTLRGDVSLGTAEEVTTFAEKSVSFGEPVGDTVVSRYLQATEEQLRESTWVVVQAVDEQGNVARDSAQVTVGGPAVEFVNLAAPQSGTDLPIHVGASDPEGISSIQVQITGAVDTTLVQEFSPALDTVALDTLLFIPSGLEGAMELTAQAVNTRGVSGSTSGRSLTISQQGSQDNTPPALSMDAEAASRLEASSNLQVTLSGNDNAGGSGIRTAGITILAISQSRGDSLLRERTVTFDRARSGTVSRTFSFRPFNVDSLNLPDTLIFEVTGYFVDDAGNCAAVTSEGSEASLPCEDVTVGGASGVVSQAQGLRLDREIVSGHTVLLPAGGRVMDATVDTLRGNLFLSNIDRNRVEVFRLGTRSFGSAIGVGSEPWGLDMVTDYSAPDPDSLVVANSNGTNLEMIDLDREEARPGERFFFPDVVIFDVSVEDGDNGISVDVTPRPQLALLDFSDRPQYLAVDTFGNRIFSTVVPTGADEVGTVRKSFFLDGWEQPETKIFVEHAIFEEAEDEYAFAHLDDMGATGGIVTMVDHRPGFPNDVFSVSVDLNRGERLADGVQAMRDRGSDVFWANGNWNIPSLGFSDTTYVSASGDGTVVAIGEGATPNLGRVLLYGAARADTTFLSGNVPAADLLTNRPEPVRGIGLNYDGTLGVVRGSSEVAFFDQGLRKQGGTATFGAEGQGAALHPLHANQKTLFNLNGQHLPDVHLAFVGTGDGSIDIIDTFRFLRIGSVRIRDRINGPLRAVLPFPGDNAGVQCSTVPVRDKRGSLIGEAVQIYQNGEFNMPAPEGVSEDRCVVAKLFAVTEAGGVVIVDVRKVDVLRQHPQR